PVIGPDVRGVNECLSAAHGGILYPFGLYSDCLAGLVLAALTDGEGMRWRRQACARFIHDRFGLERMARDYLRIYNEAPYTPCRQAPPPWSYQAYVGKHWTPGNCLYLASRRLAECRDWLQAARVARASLTTCPTLYLRGRRFAHLLRSQLNGLFALLAYPRP